MSVYDKRMGNLEESSYNSVYYRIPWNGEDMDFEIRKGGVKNLTLPRDLFIIGA